MNEQQKNIVFYLLVIAGVYFVYKIFKGLGSFIGAPEGSQSGTAVDLPVNTTKLTYSPEQYKVFADQIESAVWSGFDLTEDDEAFAQVLSQMNTNDDVKQLINAYGVRGEGVVIQKYYNLVQTVEMYLDDDLKEVVNNVYQSKGITFRWN